LPLQFKTAESYRDALSDLALWTPYVAEVLARHGLPLERVSIGDPGTFPTFLVGDVVVKFFPRRFSGAECFAIERSIYAAFADQPDLPVPRLVAHGHLFPQRWRWPYVVMTRLPGTPWSSGPPPGTTKIAVAEQLGRTLRHIHDLPCPPGRVWSSDLLTDLRATVVQRHRRWKILSPRLIEQIDRYLAAPSFDRRLIHADLHDNHLLVAKGRLQGVIDWGDALYADPDYELPSLHFGTFRGDCRLLRTFLDSYGWPVGPDFALRAMTMALIHEFCPLWHIRPLPDDISTLKALADRLWSPGD